MLLTKVVLLIWYSNEKIGFRKISYVLPRDLTQKSENDLINCLTCYKQNLSGYSFRWKNVLNFNCLKMKFHKAGHTNINPNILFTNWYVIEILRTYLTMHFRYRFPLFSCIKCRKISKRAYFKLKYLIFLIPI